MTAIRITQAERELAERHADEMPELVHATGPVSYDYHFGTRSLFDDVVRTSWLIEGTLFAWDATTLALDGEKLAGIVMAFHGPQFRERQAALVAVWRELIADGRASEQELVGILERSEHAMWLNPVVRQDRHYINAISVKPEYRGKGVGVALLQSAKEAGIRDGRVALELDVLSDNPAVQFYRSQRLELLAETRAPKPQEYGVPPELRMGTPLTG